MSRAPQVLAVVNLTTYDVVLAQALADLNISLWLSPTAADARRYLEDLPPVDLSPESSSMVLLDFHHLGESGLELLRWIRSEPRLWRTKIVVRSGRDDASDINRAYEWGIDGYVSKPARLRELALTLSGVLASEGARERFVPTKAGTGG